MTKVNKRLELASAYKQGMPCESLSLEHYRWFREMEEATFPDEVEQLCEYVLYLEEKLRNE